MLRYATLLAAREQRQNETQSIAWMRTKLVKLTKDMLGCKKLRLELLKVQKLEELTPIAAHHIARYQHVDHMLQQRWKQDAAQT